MKSLLAALPLLLCASALAQIDQPLPRKPFFGAQVSPLAPEQRGKNGVPEAGGLLIGNLVPGGSAESAAKPGDVLLKVNGRMIVMPPDLTAAVTAAKMGETVKVELIRDGKPLTLDMVLKPRPADNGPDYETIYDSVVSNGKRCRVFITRPKNVQGKLPVFFLIQGIGYVSMEQPMNGPGPYSKIRKAFNDKGYVTMLVEKPGLGDSDGVATETTFDSELDAFRAAMKALPKYDFVDAGRVVLFGHSMGGCQGPILASEFPNIKGVAVYGTVVRTWMEYIIENTRRQAQLGGRPMAELDKQMRDFIAADHILFNENLTPEEAKKQYPKWADAINLISGDGKTMSGIAWPYWQSCFKHNLPAAWAKVDANVLSIWGESEFIAGEYDHPLIAKMVKNGRYVSIKNSDHGFRNVPTPEESFKTWGQGGVPMNLEIVDVLTKWAEGIK